MFVILHVPTYLYMRSGQRMNDDIVPVSVYFIWTPLLTTSSTRYRRYVTWLLSLLLLLTHTVRLAIVFVLITRLEITVVKASQPDDPKTEWSNYKVYMDLGMTYYIIIVFVTHVYYGNAVHADRADVHCEEEYKQRVHCSFLLFVLRDHKVVHTSHIDVWIPQIFNYFRVY